MTRSVSAVLEEEVRILQEWRDEIRSLITGVEERLRNELRDEIRNNSAVILEEIKACRCSEEILAALEGSKEPKPKKPREDEDPPKDKGKGKDDDRSSETSGSIAPKRPAPTGQWWYPETNVWDKPFN